MEISIEQKSSIEEFIFHNGGIEICSVNEIVGTYGVEGVLKHLEKNHGYTRKELNGEETNGWQIDYWYYLTKENEYNICLSGSLLYGQPKLSFEIPDNGKENQVSNW